MKDQHPSHARLALAAVAIAFGALALGLAARNATATHLPDTRQGAPARPEAPEAPSALHDEISYFASLSAPAQPVQPQH